MVRPILVVLVVFQLSPEVLSPEVLRPILVVLVVAPQPLEYSAERREGWVGGISRQHYLFECLNLHQENPPEASGIESDEYLSLVRFEPELKYLTLPVYFVAGYVVQYTDCDLSCSNHLSPDEVPSEVPYEVGA